MLYIARRFCAVNAISAEAQEIIQGLWPGNATLENFDFFNL